jgi:hypothetical protein
MNFENGKYKIEGTKVLRHGEPWRDITGDKFIGCMISRIEELEAQQSVAKISAIEEETGVVVWVPHNGEPLAIGDELYVKGK